jgi:hypothetical protein
MKVSFDFDGTLEFRLVQQYATELLNEGIEVWVVTTRWDENHKHKYAMNATLDDLWAVVDSIGIPRDHVRFTCMEWKYTYLKGTNFVWHLDDNETEFDYARKNQCNVPMVDVHMNGWQIKCDSLLKRNTDDTIGQDDSAGN